MASGPTRTAEIEAISRALAELADESEALARAARPAAPLRLQELTDQTRLIRRALEEQHELEARTAVGPGRQQRPLLSECVADDERAPESDSTSGH